MTVYLQAKTLAHLQHYRDSSEVKSQYLSAAVSLLICQTGIQMTGA